MDQDTVVNLATQAMTLALKVAGPILLVGLVIGLVVSIFQAVTQIQEQSLSFIPKIVGVAAIVVILGPWMLDQLVSYAQNLYMSIPQLIGRARSRSARSCIRWAVVSRSPASSSCWRGSLRCSWSRRCSRRR